MLQVPNECSKEFSNKLSKRYHLPAPDTIEMSQKLPTVPHENKNSDTNPQAVTSIPPAASIPTYVNGRRIAVTAIESQQEGHYATIEKKNKKPLLDTPALLT